MSGMYRFKLPGNREALVQTKSKMFNFESPTDSFIMSTHTIIKDCTDGADGSSANDLLSSLMQPNVHNSSSRSARCTPNILTATIHAGLF